MDAVHPACCGRPIAELHSICSGYVAVANIADVISAASCSATCLGCYRCMYMVSPDSAWLVALTFTGSGSSCAPGSEETVLHCIAPAGYISVTDTCVWQVEASLVHPQMMQLRVPQLTHLSLYDVVSSELALPSRYDCDASIQ